MKAKVLTTDSERSTGVIGRDSLDHDEVYIFINIYPYTSFHMREVKFPLDIAFLDQDCGILDIKQMDPEEGNATAPSGTVYAVEAAKDYFKTNNLKINDLWKEVHNLVNIK